MPFKMKSFIFWSGVYNAGLGLIAVPLGLGDLAIGLVTMFGLPKELGVSHCALLCDRLDWNPINPAINYKDNFKCHY